MIAAHVLLALDILAWSGSGLLGYIEYVASIPSASSNPAHPALEPVGAADPRPSASSQPSVSGFLMNRDEEPALIAFGLTVLGIAQFTYYGRRTEQSVPRRRAAHPGRCVLVEPARASIFGSAGGVSQVTVHAGYAVMIALVLCGSGIERKMSSTACSTPSRRSLRYLASDRLFGRIEAPLSPEQRRRLETLSLVQTWAGTAPGPLVHRPRSGHEVLMLSRNARLPDQRSSRTRVGVGVARVELRPD